jgi:hypothetical protein
MQKQEEVISKKGDEDFTFLWFSNRDSIKGGNNLA